MRTDKELERLAHLVSFFLLGLLFCLAIAGWTTARASELKHEDVLRQLDKPDRVIQRESVFYYPLEHVISKQQQKVIKMEKELKKLQFHSQKPKVELREGEGVDLYQWACAVLDQKNGRCTAYGATKALCTYMNQKYQTHEFEFSPDWAWKGYAQPYMHLMAESMRTRKQLEMKYWPHERSSPLVKNPNALARGRLLSLKYLGSDPWAAVEELKKGHPVILGSSVSQDMASCLEVFRPDSPNTRGGHATALLGFRASPSRRDTGGLYFLGENSWSENCHAKGRFALPLSYCEKPQNFCMFLSVEEAEMVE